MERSAHSPAPLPPSEMSFSVEPVMLTKAPRDPTQEEPQPSTSTSHFCVASTTASGPMAATACPASGRFSANTLLKRGDPLWWEEGRLLQVSLWKLFFIPYILYNVYMFYEMYKNWGLSTVHLVGGVLCDYVQDHFLARSSDFPEPPLVVWYCNLMVMTRLQEVASSDQERIT